MAKINHTNIPAKDEYHKEVVNQITFTGNELDQGTGTIYIHSKERLVENTPPTYPAILDAEGRMQYKSGAPSIEADVLTELAENIQIDVSEAQDGSEIISTQQVFSFLTKWTDYKKGETVPGLVVE